MRFIKQLSRTNFKLVLAPIESISFNFDAFDFMSYAFKLVKTNQCIFIECMPRDELEWIQFGNRHGDWREPRPLCVCHSVYWQHLKDRYHNIKRGRNFKRYLLNGEYRTNERSVWNVSTKTKSYVTLWMKRCRHSIFLFVRNLSFSLSNIA